VCVYTLAGEALSWAIGRKCPCLLAEIKYRKSQVIVAPASQQQAMRGGDMPKAQKEDCP
jgi:hypothetical protein